jgi:hypothetical protein
MILIYSTQKTPRLEYTLQLIFHDILNSEAIITTNPDEFRISPLPKINYSESFTEEELFLKAHPLLIGNEISQFDLYPIEYEGEYGFFETSADSFLPFDPFATAFYLVSRMEEYIPGNRDQHGRFPACESVLSRYNLLDKAVVNRLSRLIADKMEKKSGKKLFPPPSFTFLSTIDVDNAWAYLHKGFFRTAGAFVKDILKIDFKGLKERVKVLSGKEKDPYDTYDYLKNQFGNLGDKVRFFFLLGDYAQYDKPVSWKNRKFRMLISGISHHFEAGIHPSGRSAQPGKSDLVETEKKRLEEIILTPVQRSRQHFLKLTFPETYQNLIKAGITEDYSMGYPELPGFRAGICTPFYFYDLSAERTTPLRIFPFQVMEVTLNQYMGLSPEAAWSTVIRLMEEVKLVGGVFCSIWHNESLSDQGKWKGYRMVFEKMIETAQKYENQN